VRLSLSRWLGETQWLRRAKGHRSARPERRLSWMSPDARGQGRISARSYECVVRIGSAGTRELVAQGAKE
jgi:hypothetical protein